MNVPPVIASYRAPRKRSRSWKGWLTALIALAVLLLICTARISHRRQAADAFDATAVSFEEDQPGSAKAPGDDDIFAGTNVLRIRILIPNSGIAALRSSGWGNGQERPKVKAMVREGGVLYTNVEIHLKGAAGSFRSIDDNPGLTLNFEKSAPGQTFHGYHKISLNNSVQDRSFLTEKICRELFEAAGVPAPHSGFAKVELNGRDLGLRVMVEGWGKHFLKRYFKNTKGNLYDGGFVEDIDAVGRLGVNSGDDPNDHTALLALNAAIREPTATRFAKLQEVLDMDRFLSFVAMDVMMCDWDGYAMNHNNWRLFHNKESNKMVFFPHGMDQMFGVQRTTPECPILPRMQGKVAWAVLSTSEGRRKYYERMSELYTNVWHVDALLKRVDQLAAVIDPVIAERSWSSGRHNSEVEYLKERIAKRDDSLRQQLASLKDPQTPGGLSGWTKNTQTGSPVFRMEKGPEGQDVLYLSGSGDTICSWRSRTMLDEGLYRLEGKIRTKDIKPASAEPNAGAGLRVAGRGVAAAEFSGTQDWQKFSYPFRVQAGGATVTAVCEFRASRGEAWFDTSSLQIVKVR